MIGCKSQGLQILKNFHAGGGVAPPLAPNKIIMGGGLSPSRLYPLKNSAHARMNTDGLPLALFIGGKQL